jgi:hypothetical protein
MTATAIGFQHRYAIDSDNYELFPDVDEVAEEEPDQKMPEEGFAVWVDRANRELNDRTVDKYSFSRYDFST